MVLGALDHLTAMHLGDDTQDTNMKNHAEAFWVYVRSGDAKQIHNELHQEPDAHTFHKQTTAVQVHVLRHEIT